MTLVVLAVNRNSAVLLGDALLSVEGPGIGSPLPALPNGLKAKAGERRAVGGSQKIVAINDELMLGWSGPEILAAAFIRTLKAEYGLQTPTLGELNAFIDAYPREDLKGLQFIIVIWKPGGMMVLVSPPEAFVDLGEVKIMAIGSGAGAFVLHLMTDPYIQKAISDPSEHILLSILGTFAFTEMLNQSDGQSGIPDGWGGAFEIAASLPAGAPLAKLDRVLIAAMDVGSVDDLKVAPLWYYLFQSEGRLNVLATHEDSGTRLYQIGVPGEPLVSPVDMESRPLWLIAPLLGGHPDPGVTVNIIERFDDAEPARIWIDADNFSKCVVHFQRDYLHALFNQVREDHAPRGREWPHRNPD